MNKILFLFKQNKIAVGIAIFFSQFPALADAEFAIMSPLVSQDRAALGIFLVEIVACLIVMPTLLFAFKVTGRIKQILGVIPASIIFVVAWLIMMYFTRTSAEATPGNFTVVFAIEVILFAVIIGILLLVVKGKSTFFEANPAETSASVKESNLTEVVQVAGNFCGQCGSQVAATSKFCSKCGNAILAAQE